MGLRLIFVAELPFFVRIFTNALRGRSLEAYGASRERLRCTQKSQAKQIPSDSKTLATGHLEFDRG